MPQTIRFNEICDQAFTTKPASREVVSYILAAVCASGSGGDFSDSWDQHAVLPRAVRGFSHEVALISARFGLHELGLVSVVPVLCVRTKVTRISSVATNQSGVLNT